MATASQIDVDIALEVFPKDKETQKAAKENLEEIQALVQGAEDYSTQQQTDENNRQYRKLKSELLGLSRYGTFQKNQYSLFDALAKHNPYDQSKQPNADRRKVFVPFINPQGQSKPREYKIPYDLMPQLWDEVLDRLMALKTLALRQRKQLQALQEYGPPSHEYQDAGGKRIMSSETSNKVCGIPNKTVNRIINEIIEKRNMHTDFTKQPSPSNAAMKFAVTKNNKGPQEPIEEVTNNNKGKQEPINSAVEDRPTVMPGPSNAGGG